MQKILLPLLLAAVISGCTAQDHYIQISGHAQGGVYAVKLNLKGSDLDPQAAKDSVESLLHRIDSTLSGYNRSSQLSRFNEGRPVLPDSLFLDMYAQAYGWWKRSEGALDFAAGPLYDAWGFGFRESRFPSDEAIRGILGSCGMRLLPPALPISNDGRVHPDAIGNPSLNYNAIAQGYSCDLIAAFLRRHGVKDMLVDIGEIWCEGLNPSRRPWSVGVDRPEDREGESVAGDRGLSGIWSTDGRPCGVVTSGNYRKFYIRDGRKYAHTIDPRSGYPVSHNLLSATIVSFRSATEADALATWCMVEGEEKAKALILSDGAIEGCLISGSENGEMEVWTSPGFVISNR